MVREETTSEDVWPLVFLLFSSSLLFAPARNDLDPSPLSLFSFHALFHRTKRTYPQKRKRDLHDIILVAVVTVDALRHT